MSLLDVFVMKFVTEGLDDVASDVSKLSKTLDKLEVTEEKAEEAIKDFAEQSETASHGVEKLDKTIKKAKNTTSGLDKAVNKTFGQSGLNGFLMQSLKTLSPYILAINAIRNAFGQISKLSEGIDAYNKALKISNKYRVFTKEDARQAKDFEITMRDVRMGMTAISANLAKALLPTLNKIAVIARNITDFLLDHMPAIKIALAVIGITLLPSIIKGFSKLFGLINTKTILITGLILLLDDIYAWMVGGESAFGDFWDKLFGSPKKLMDTLQAIPNWLKVIGSALGVLAILNPWQTLTLGGKGFMLGLQGVWGILKLFPNMISLIAAAVRTLTTFMLANPILAALSAVLAVLILVWQNWDKITAAVKKATEAVKGFFKSKIDGGISDIGANDKDSKNKLKVDGSHASGLDYVPYDGYIAELHKGERVQTASEASDWRSSLMAAKKAVNFTANYPLNSIPAGAVSNAYNNSNSDNSTKTITFSGDIVINTQATDGQGVFEAFKSYVKEAVINLDDGMLA